MWNNSSTETIATLLELDDSTDSISEKVHGEFVEREAKSRMVTMQKVVKEVDQMNALHLALTHGNNKVIELLLKRESSEERKSVKENTVLARDCRGRLPLHLACIHSQKNSSSVIKRLLDLDRTKVSTQALDHESNTPLHYACDDSNANADIVGELISGEEKFLVNKSRNGSDRLEDRPEGYFIDSPNLKLSSHYLNEDNNSPLFLAIRGGASEKVLEQLLQSDHFFLKGSDTLLSDLSQNISKNKSMQTLVIDKLAERCYFFLLLVDVYSHMASLIFFLIISDVLLKTLGEDVPEFNIETTTLTVLWACIVVSALRYVIFKVHIFHISLISRI